LIRKLSFGGDRAKKRLPELVFEFDEINKMVVIEDLDEIDDPTSSSSSSSTSDPKAPTIKKGFLNDDNRDSLYGPDGSEQGKVTEKQKQQWAVDDMNREQNKKSGLGRIQFEAEAGNYDGVS